LRLQNPARVKNILGEAETRIVMNGPVLEERVE